MKTLLIVMVLGLVGCSEPRIPEDGVFKSGGDLKRYVNHKKILCEQIDLQLEILSGVNLKPDYGIYDPNKYGKTTVYYYCSNGEKLMQVHQ